MVRRLPVRALWNGVVLTLGVLFIEGSALWIYDRALLIEDRALLKIGLS